MWKLFPIQCLSNGHTSNRLKKVLLSAFIEPSFTLPYSFGENLKPQNSMLPFNASAGRSSTLISRVLFFVNLGDFAYRARKNQREQNNMMLLLLLCISWLDVVNWSVSCENTGGWKWKMCPFILTHAKQRCCKHRTLLSQMATVWLIAGKVPVGIFDQWK